MRKRSFEKKRISGLNRGKVKGVGLFEKIPLKIAGCVDGRRGLPRENSDGRWVSPHIEKEIRSYDEFSARMWGQLQFEEKDAYSRLGELIDSIKYIKGQLDKARFELDEALAAESNNLNFRKDGESKLSDAQVISRRKKERDKKLFPKKDAVSSLQTKLTSEINEFSAIRAKIIEDNNSARMVCTRVREHLYQRLAIYWNSALCKHPESNKMPAVPDVEILFYSEEIYMKPHVELLQNAELLNEIIKRESKEV